MTSPQIQSLLSGAVLSKDREFDDWLSYHGTDKASVK